MIPCSDLCFGSKNICNFLIHQSCASMYAQIYNYHRPQTPMHAPAMRSLTLELIHHLHPAIPAKASLALPSLMFRRTPLTPKRAHSRNIRLEPLLLRRIRPRRQLNKRMQRHLHPGALLLRHVHVICIYAPQHGLMRDDDDILAAFELHDDGFQANDDVAIALAAPVPIIILVIISGPKILRVAIRNLLIRKPITDPRVELIEGLPLEFIVAFRGGGEEAGGLDGAFEGGGPDCELAVVADGAGDEVGEGAGVEFAALGDVGVAADFAGEVEFGFAVLGGWGVSGILGGMGGGRYPGEPD